MRKAIFAANEYYHIYNRGTEKRNVFNNQREIDRFLGLLYICNRSESANMREQGRSLKEIGVIATTQKLVSICAYCLMPNHFHLLLKEVSHGGISKFMQKILTGYTLFFNANHERSGALFQGKFKAEHVNNDEYLKYIISYIHLNPVKIIEPHWKEKGIIDAERAKRFLSNYGPSSYLDFTGLERIEGQIIDKNGLPKYFDTPRDYEACLNSWLNYRAN